MRDASLQRRIRRRPALVLVGTSWPFPRSRLHYDALPAEVDGALAEGEELALAQPGQASEAKEVAIGLDRIRGELLDIDPVEEPHLGPLPGAASVRERSPRRRSGLALARCGGSSSACRASARRPAARNRKDVILHVGRADRLELPAVEDG